MTTFQLETLTCPTCVTKIEKSIKKLKGIKQLDVLFNSSKVKIEFDETLTNIEEISKMIRRIGYDVLNIK